MLVLSVFLPLLLDRLAWDSAVDAQPRLSALRQALGLTALPPGTALARVRVHLILEPKDILAGLTLNLDVTPQPDGDDAFSLMLPLDASIPNLAGWIKDGVVKHWIQRHLSRRMTVEGRELAHLSDHDLDQLINTTRAAAESSERWGWRLPEWTTFEAALLEREAREHESEHARLRAIASAKGLLALQAAEVAGVLAWWRDAPPVARALALRAVPRSLPEPERLVAVHRGVARFIAEELALAGPPA